MGELIVIVAISAVGFGAIYLIGTAIEEVFGLNRPPSPPPSPEDYDQQAALNRAAARALDAQAAYDDSRAKAALKRHELVEVEQFIKDHGGRR